MPTDPADDANADPSESETANSDTGKSDAPKSEAAPSDAGSDEAAVTLPVVFRINGLAYFTVPMMAVVTIILSGTSLVWLGWTLVIPFILAWWIRHVRTVVTEDGLHAVHTFGTRDVAWTDLEGLQFPRWSAVRAVTMSGARVKLPAIGFDDLPQLSVASRGRIPDPFAIPDE
ncbi:PH domain-containing protein [Gordonia sp. LSe1-13]|uniref:PH domain-containing protein n=1 Tax=Gordonia sesuvii TaxID=3116777 RepID=A0ABU7MHR5_9ACTN|nr:PH domain-containing protein [Gordonia sp. LSe1-13]